MDRWRNGALVLALASGCGPEAAPLPEIGATLCFGVDDGPQQPFIPAPLGANGEPVHCVTEVNEYFSFSQDACFEARMEAAGFERAPGWGGQACEDGSGGFIMPNDEGWEAIQCWHLSPTDPSATTCYGLAHERWIWIRPPCTRDDILNDPRFQEVSVEALCPAEDPARLPRGAICFDEVDPDPDAQLVFSGCLQPVGETWVSLFTSCLRDQWAEPIPESDTCGL